MKRRYIIALTATLALLRAANLYADDFTVVKCAGDVVTMEDSRGELYTLENVNYSIGDNVFCILDDQETPSREDDVIIYHKGRD